MYRTFNSILHSTKTFITMNMDKHLKRIMTKLRFGVSEICSHEVKSVGSCNGWSFQTFHEMTVLVSGCT